MSGTVTGANLRRANARVSWPRRYASRRGLRQLLVVFPDRLAKAGERHLRVFAGGGDIVEVWGNGVAADEDGLTFLSQPIGRPSPPAILRGLRDRHTGLVCRLFESGPPVPVPVGGIDELLDPSARRAVALIVLEDRVQRTPACRPGRPGSP